jgi:Domain of unknown function (DUF4440)
MKRIHLSGLWRTGRTISGTRCTLVRVAERPEQVPCDVLFGRTLMRVTLFFMIGTLTPLVAAMPQGRRVSDDSAAVATLEYRVEEATMRRNVTFLDSLYAPTFRFKHSTGALEERAPRLAALQSGTATVFARDLDSLDVEVHGDVALTTGRIHVRQVSPDPKWREYTVRYVRVYIRSAGRWLLLTHHSTGESHGPLQR